MLLEVSVGVKLKRRDGSNDNEVYDIVAAARYIMWDASLNILAGS